MIAQLWLTYVITKYLITKHDGSTRALTVTVYKYPTRVLCLTFPFLLVDPLNIIPFFCCLPFKSYRFLRFDDDDDD